MLEELEEEIADVEEKIGDKMKKLDLDGDGLLSADELTQVALQNYPGSEWERITKFTGNQDHSQGL